MKFTCDMYNLNNLKTWLIVSNNDVRSSIVYNLAT